jgi:hypothetical protein
MSKKKSEVIPEIIQDENEKLYTEINEFFYIYMYKRSMFPSTESFLRFKKYVKQVLNIDQLECRSCLLENFNKLKSVTKFDEFLKNNETI